MPWCRADGISFPLAEPMSYSLETSVHEGVSAWLHHPQLVQSGPNLVSARSLRGNERG